MNREMGFSSKLRRLTAPVCVMIRGELAIGAHLRAANSHEGGTVKGGTVTVKRVTVQGRLASTLVVEFRMDPQC
jgi:hypothetical protein